MINETTFVWLILTLTWSGFLWELYLSFRQLRVYQKSTSIPPELLGTADLLTFGQARMYSMDKLKFGMVNDLYYSLLLTTGLVVLHGLRYFWTISESLVEMVGLEVTELNVSPVFMCVMSSFDTLTSVAFDGYDSFVIDEMYGFNEESVGFFLKKKLKLYFVSQLLTLVLTYAKVYVVLTVGDDFFVYAWRVVALSLFLWLTVYPEYIAPMFSSYVPLPEGALKTQILNLASTLDFPLSKLYVLVNSRRSPYDNMFIYGMFKSKTLVLYDSLFDNDEDEDKKGCTDKEILAILCHELGHWKSHHHLKQTAVEFSVLLLLLFAVRFLIHQEELYRAAGFYDDKPVIVGFYVILLYILSPSVTVLSFFLAWMSRRFEFQADGFAASLGMASSLRTALVKLHRVSLDFPVDDWLYSQYYHTYPTLLERLRALNKFE